MWPWNDEKPKTVFESLFGKKTKKSKDCHADMLKIIAKMKDKVVKHTKAETKKCDKRVRKAERLHRKLGLSDLGSLSDLSDSSSSYSSDPYDMYDGDHCPDMSRKLDDLQRKYDALKGAPNRSYKNKLIKIKFAVVRADTLRSTQVRSDQIPYADQERLRAHAKQVVPLVKQVAGQVSDVEVVMQANSVVVSAHVSAGHMDDIRRAVRNFPHKVIGGLYRLKDPTVS